MFLKNRIVTTSFNTYFKYPVKKTWRIHFIHFISVLISNEYSINPKIDRKVVIGKPICIKSLPELFYTDKSSQLLDQTNPYVVLFLKERRSNKERVQTLFLRLDKRYKLTHYCKLIDTWKTNVMERTNSFLLKEIRCYVVWTYC